MALILMLSGSPSVSAAPSFLILGDARIGDFATRKGATLGDAVAAFGQPDTRQFNSLVDACTAAWDALGLRMVFVNVTGGDPCGNGSGFFVKATMRSPGVWVTGRGLGIGAAVAKLRALYPRATSHPSTATWWLIPRVRAIGGGKGRFPGLLARVRNGRVASFTVQVVVPGK